MSDRADLTDACHRLLKADMWSFFVVEEKLTSLFCEIAQEFNDALIDEDYRIAAWDDDSDPKGTFRANKVTAQWLLEWVESWDDN